MKKILFFGASLRNDSLNKQLAKIAFDYLKSKNNLVVTYIDLKNYPIPIYDGDLEQEITLPENALAIRKMFIEHDAVFIATPEYNSSFPSLLKNIIEWCSRGQKSDTKRLMPFSDKVWCVSSASPSIFGGIRGVNSLKNLLGNILIHVFPHQLQIAKAHEIIMDNKIINEEIEKNLFTILDKFEEFVLKI